jgi:hypothetical protein
LANLEKAYMPAQATYRLLWAIPVYSAIFIGMYVLPNAWVAVFGFHLALSLALLPRLRTLPSRWLVPVSPAFLLAMICAGLLAGAGLWLLWPYTGASEHYQTQLSTLGLTGNFTWIVFTVYFSLVNPWLEEAFWRDALTHPTRRPALVDLLYAGFHLIVLAPFVSYFWLLVAFLILAVTGWLWRVITHVSGSLLPAVVCHLLADFSILLVLYQRSL